MQLITNDNGTDHLQTIRKTFRRAANMTVCVAFAKERAVAELEPLLENVLKRGGHVTTFAGTDFYLTEPAALRRLLKLKERHGECECFVFSDGGDTFHPKIYMGRQGDAVHYMIGSANLTMGGLASNTEASFLGKADAQSELAAQLTEFFDRLRQNGRCKKLTALWLNQYEAAYRRYDDSRRNFKAAVRNIRQEALFDTARVQDYLQRFHAKNDYIDELPRRRQNYRDALHIQNEICDTPRLSKQRFSALLGDLMGSAGHQHLWHSGDIYRQGSAATAKPEAMSTLFRTIRDHVGRPPAEVFQVAMDGARTIRGVGINMATEIMTTFDPSTYAILNNNTRTSLKELGFHELPTLGKSTFKSVRYADHVDLLTQLRDEIGAIDFLEVDSFLNFIYFDLKGTL